MKSAAKRASSSSDVQQLAEPLLIEELSKLIGKQLGSARIPVGNTTVCVDGFFRDESEVILVEAWAHIGRAKSAQANKVRGDLLKLAFLKSLFARSATNLRVRCYLVFADKIAARMMESKRSWVSQAAQHFGIEFTVIQLAPELVKIIEDAQKRQDIRVVDADEGSQEDEA